MLELNAMPGQGKIFVFSAASGAGKTTLLNHIRSVFPNVVYSISATTRPPRVGESNGVHYFFLSEKEFFDKRDAGAFAEWALVHGHWYGSPKSFIDGVIASGKHIIMDIDVFGKKKFDESYPHALGILLLPPSLEELRRRLRIRNTDSEESIRLRLENARKEMDFARTSGKYEFTIVNNDLAKAKTEAETIIRNALTGY